jgi:hypothetical protein
MLQSQVYNMILACVLSDGEDFHCPITNFSICVTVRARKVGDLPLSDCLQIGCQNSVQELGEAPLSRQSRSALVAHARMPNGFVCIKHNFNGFAVQVDSFGEFEQ